MAQIFSLFLIGVALSMDTFSLSLGIGMFTSSNKKAIKLAGMVGIMHFFMPLLGVLIGKHLINIFKLKSDILLGIILIFIAIQMTIDIIKHKEEQFKLNIIGMFLFALGVSIDSFSVGIGLNAITNNIYLAMIIFAICSFFFTFFGIIIGKQANKILGIYANIFGIIILFLLGLAHLL